MKLQCSCGAKYSFDITADMLQNPVKFVCPSCGADSSEFVNELVRKEFDAAPTTQLSPPAPETPRLKISHAAPAAAPAAPPESEAASKYCQKHRGVPVSEQCSVCEKPICPQCLELFGYFCSPFCKSKATNQNQQTGVYAGRKDLVEARFWRHTGLIFGALAVLVLSAIGFWGWYVWCGSIPHAAFSVRFEEKSFTGDSKLVDNNQFVFLHGGTLARYDLKTQKPVWSQGLITPAEFAAAVAEENRAEEQLGGKRTLGSLLEKYVRKRLEAGLTLHVAGQNIWVSRDDKLIRYDWATGNPVQTVALPTERGPLVLRDNDLATEGRTSITHINLANGETRTERIAAPGETLLAQNGTPETGGGLPLNPGADSGKPLDPQKVTAQAQNLKIPGQLALPAILANSQNQARILKELNDEKPVSAHKPQSTTDGLPETILVRGPNGDLLLSVKLLEARFVTRNAMKAAPKKSALDGEVNAAHTMDIANETLNEMQRNAGGDKVTEDESRYLVSVRKAGEPETAGWSGEVVGPAQLFPLKNLTVLTAGKGVVALDLDNKKLWQASLTYTVPGKLIEADDGFSHFGDGPVVERDGVLYVFDQAVLTAFDLKTGNARWRLPSVGIIGLWFDESGAVYVNTTSGSPDDLKYSRQIDVTKSTDAIVQKIDGQSGKILWTAKPGAYISYLSGKFIYAVQTYDSGVDPDDALSDTMAGLQKPDYLRIVRLNPKNGKLLWIYEDQRYPFSLHFHDNVIEIGFKKEMQVLKYLAF
jgi:outer membrane protein assembly factor BamB